MRPAQLYCSDKEGNWIDFDISEIENIEFDYFLEPISFDYYPRYW
jgi:hypothetical protein